ncbi:hypothetical protein [Mycobacterium ulcerans]|uniref:hypothetical protein n=1 Tax=Mycobacterium ulcerans TaxID=1809 RepID=UPI0012DC79F5|nr:hypothetical protein [Mycobacterium ulcerans]
MRDRRAARPNPNFDVRIVDDDGTGLPTGMVGEIVCRPGYPNAMSAGYLRQHSGFGLHIAPHPRASALLISRLVSWVDDLWCRAIGAAV